MLRRPKLLLVLSSALPPIQFLLSVFEILASCSRFCFNRNTYTTDEHDHDVQSVAMLIVS